MEFSQNFRGPFSRLPGAVECVKEWLNSVLAYLASFSLPSSLLHNQDLQ